MSRRKQKLEAALDDLFTAQPGVEVEVALPAREHAAAAPAPPAAAGNSTPPSDVAAEPLAGTAPPVAGSAPASVRADSGATAFEDAQQFVIFTLGAEQFGVEINAVEGVISPQSITPVPRMPDYVTGVTNLRGQVLPVIDLHRRLGIAANGNGVAGAQHETGTRIVVVTIAGEGLGLVVDSVAEVRWLPTDAIEPPAPIVSPTDLSFSFIHGVASVGDEIVILLELDALLTDGE